MSHTILSLDNLAVSRGEYLLCQHINLGLQAGDICHLVGENGLGKTTLLMQIIKLLPTLTGQITIIDNKPPLYVSHQSALHERLSVGQNLRFLLALYGIRPSDDELRHALSCVGLAGFDDVMTAQLSAGQTRRVSLARLWLTNPSITPLWLLDEPLTALDVAMTDKLCQKLTTFAQAGGSILITSHQPISVANRWLNLSDHLPQELEGDL